MGQSQGLAVAASNKSEVHQHSLFDAEQWLCKPEENCEVHVTGTASASDWHQCIWNGPRGQHGAKIFGSAGFVMRCCLLLSPVVKEVQTSLQIDGLTRRSTHLR